ncbi:MAG: helix-turn-helix domain-containing protein [Suilimivivens sp.]
MGTLDIIKSLCTKNGTSIKNLERELGFSNGSLAKSATIKAERLQKIAEYFGVSVDYLMTGNEKSDLSDGKYYINEKTAEVANKILHSKELKQLFDAASDAEPEDIATVHQMLLALKRKERGDID